MPRPAPGRREELEGARAAGDLPVYITDLARSVRRNPYEGQRVLLADGGSERLEALITEIRGDGTGLLSVPAYAKPLRVTG
jgi:hypothetical protein